MADFNPHKVARLVRQWVDNRKIKTLSPALGSKAAVIYVEASANLSAINNLIAQIEALAVETVKYVWDPTAEDGCVPKVTIMVTVDPEGTPPPE